MPTLPALSLTVPEAVARIRARNPVLRAFIRTRLDEALREHRARLLEAPRSPLHNVPYALKDMWDTAGIATTAGSYRYRTRVPTESSPVHLALEAAGAVLLGKTNLSDLAIVPESDNYLAGATCNPHDPSCTAGGSSGGAAAAVADGMVAFDWGSDFGGSIRLPAAYCGVLGLRLSTETWPVRGIFPALPPSLAYMNGQGPIARDAATLRAVLAATAPALRTGPSRRFVLRGAMLWGPEGGSAGLWPRFSEDVAPALARVVGQVRRDHGLVPVRRARMLGPALVSAHYEDLAAADTMSIAEGVRAAASALVLRGRFGDKRFHPQTAALLALIALGGITVFRNRARALREAESFRADVASLWDRGYVIAAPTCTYPAPHHGGTLRNPHLLAFTMPGNVVDATAIALPFGRFPNGLPRSLQLWGPPGSEEILVDLAERLLDTPET